MDEKEISPDLSNEETLLSDEVMETDFLSENQQIESQNAVVYKRASSTDMATLLRDFGIKLPTKIAGLPSADGVPAPQATAGNSILEMKKTTDRTDLDCGKAIYSTSCIISKRHC